MKKTILYILIIAALGLGIWKYLSQPVLPDGNEKPTIKIGAILPITGGTAKMGEGARNGALMAIDKINSNPDNKYIYKFIFEDIGLDQSKTVPIYKKLTEFDKVVALVSYNSAVGKIIKPLTGKDKVLHISSALDNGLPDNKFNYMNGFSLVAASNKFIDYLKSKDLKTISLVFVNHASTEAMFNILEPTLKENNIEILSINWFNPEQRDFKMEALRVKNLNPDIVYVHIFEPVLSLFSRELLRNDYKGELSTLQLFAFSDNPSLFEGQSFVGIKNGSDEFDREYQGRFGIESQASSTVTYDSIMLIARFVEKYGLPKETLPEDMKNKLGDIISTYEGPLGQLRIDDNGLIFSDMAIKVMRNGKPVEEIQKTVE